MHIGFGLGLWQQHAAFNPLLLFANGEQGVWYDPSDLSTLFQDTAGTIPVTAAGQSVGLMKDKSGRGNHATQATATSRPILQTTNGLWYLAFDGVDDSLQTGNIDFTATDKTTLWAGLLKASDAAAAMLCELGPNYSANNGSFAVYAPHGTSLPTYAMASRGTAPQFVAAGGYPSPHKAVLTGTADISAPSIVTRINGFRAASNAAAQGTGNYGLWPLYIGKRASPVGSYLNGNLYGLIVRGVKSTDAEISQTEAWLNAKTGAY